MKFILACALLAPSLALAASPFDGTWKTDLASVKFPSMPTVLLLKDGVYTCASCVPKVTAKADGTDQPVKGHPYYDTIAIQITDPQTVVVTEKLAGKPSFINTMTVTSDGKTMTTSAQNMTGAQPITASFTTHRDSTGPKGAHAISGSWTRDKVTDASALGTTIVYTGTANGLQMSWNGESYDAAFDGKMVPVNNDPGKTMVSLKRLSANAFQETDSRDGKVVEVMKVTVSADGKSLMVVDQNKQRGTTITYKMDKQA